MMQSSARDMIRSNVPKASAEGSVVKAISEMTRKSIREMVVVSNSTLEGMLTIHSVLDGTINPTTSKIRTVMFPPPTIRPEESVEIAARKMLQSGVETIPVVDDGNLLGAVCIDDILEQYEGDEALEEFMSLSPITINEKESIDSARALMLNHRVNRLIVVDDHFRLSGMVEGRDLVSIYIHPIESETLGELAGVKHHALGNPVTSIMPRELHTLARDRPVREAIRLMLDKRLRAIPISNETGEPIGLVTRKGILRRLIEPAGRRALVQIKGLEEEEDFTVGVFKKVTGEYVQKLSTFITGLEKVHVHVKRLHDKKANVEYEVKVRAVAGLKVHVATANSWDLIACTSKAFKRLEKEVTPRKRR